MTDYLIYHQYLLKESFLGFIYRRFVLYPFIRFLTGPHFLDIGCGTGIFLTYGSKKSIGLDVNPYNVSFVNSKRRANAKLINSDGSFPINSSTFPVVICDQVIEHIEDPSILLSEISRVIKPNGLIIVGLPLEKGFKSDPDHKKFYDLNSFLAMISNKYCMKYIKHFYFPVPFKFAGKFFSWQYMYILFQSRK